jgi:ABC-type Fe3+-hydroxamate transport system substrate-binding protein
MKREITIIFPPRRIISLVPSQTELLGDLGLEREVVGITKFCVYPEKWKKQKVIVGGTKKFNYKIIEELDPQLIIGNKEENFEEGIRQLEKKYPVWMSDIVQFEDALEMILALGNLTDKSKDAQSIAEKIRRNFSLLKPMKSASVLYLIWRNPWMGVGANTFIHTLLEKAGLRNSLHHTDRYPVLTDDDIAKLHPDLILLSSEPYPFRSKHIPELKVISPQAKVLLVDGEMFSWYGSRLIQAPGYFNSLSL